MFDETTLRRMAETMPEVLRAIGTQYVWSALTQQQKEALRKHYHEWLVLRDSGRLVTLETTNVVLDIEVSPTPIMEPFKRLHRYIDVLKEREALLRASLENQRRQALLDAGRLGDPDIENVSMISADPELAKLVSTGATQ